MAIIQNALVCRISRHTLLHENFAVSRSISKNREIKMPRKMHFELNREIKIPRKKFYWATAKLKCSKKFGFLAKKNKLN